MSEGLLALHTWLDAYISQEAADELPRLRPAPPPLPGGDVLVYFDKVPVKVQYEAVRRELRVAHCFKELEDVSHAFDHLVVMLLMLPRSTARDECVETIVNLKGEFYGAEESDGCVRATSKDRARSEHAAVQRDVQRSTDCPIVYRS